MTQMTKRCFLHIGHCVYVCVCVFPHVSVTMRRESKDFLELRSRHSRALVTIP